MNTKLYVLVRRDLPWAVRLVQAVHAALQLLNVNHARLAPSWGEFGPPVVLLSVDNERDLADWLGRLGNGAVGFREPDLDHALTAVAYCGEHATLDTLRLL